MLHLTFPQGEGMPESLNLPSSGAGRGTPNPCWEGAGLHLPAKPPGGGSGNWGCAAGTAPPGSPTRFAYAEQMEGETVAISSALLFSVVFKLFIQL